MSADQHPSVPAATTADGPSAVALAPAKPTVGPSPTRTKELPKRASWGRIGTVFLTLIVIGAYAAYRYGDIRRGEEKEKTTRALTGKSSGSDNATEVRVEVVLPRAGGMGRSTRQNGSVSPFEYSALHAKVSGYLSVLTVDIGDAVKEGQELAVIDVPELHKAVDQAKGKLEDMRAQKKQAEAHLKAVNAALGTARSQLAKAQSEVARTVSQRVYRAKALERIKDLAIRSSVERKLVDEEEDRYQAAQADEQAAQAGVLAAEAFITEAQAKVELAEADVEQAAATIQVAEADLGKAQVMAAYTRLKSPYEGVITQRGYHRGDFIRSAADGLGTPLLTVARVDLMRIILQVPESDVPFLNKDDPANFIVDALGGRVFEGRVSRTAQSEDTRDRTMRTEIDLPNPDGSLVGGMFGYVTIQLEPPDKGLTVPSSCLVEHGGEGQGAVFVIQDGRAHKTKIQIGRDNGIDVEVLAGLTAKDQVIARGVGTIKDGMAVRLEKKP